MLRPPGEIGSPLSEVTEDPRLDWKGLEKSEDICRSFGERLSVIVACACASWLLREPSSLGATGLLPETAGASLGKWESFKWLEWL